LEYKKYTQSKHLQYNNIANKFPESPLSKNKSFAKANYQRSSKASNLNPIVMEILFVELFAEQKDWNG